MQEKHKRLTALLFDGVSFASFYQSLNYVNQFNISTIPSKGIALIEDYTILVLQTGEILIDSTSKRFKTKSKLSKLSKAWYYVKRDGIPFVLGTVAATAFYTYQYNPQFNPVLGSDICWIIGLASQYVKNRILYRKEPNSVNDMST